MITTFDKSKTARQSAHLTAEQLGELLECSSATHKAQAGEAQEHVRACAECSAELASLREALALFRETTSAYANEQLAGAQRMQSARDRVPARRAFSPALLWAAAGLLVVAGMLPLEVQHQRGREQIEPAAARSPAVKQPSDEVLLDEVNVALSASVPAAMQPLEDPSGTATNQIVETQLSTTRKN